MNCQRALKSYNCYLDNILCRFSVYCAIGSYNNYLAIYLVGTTYLIEIIN